MTKKHISIALVAGIVCVLFGTSLLFVFEVPRVQAAGTTPAITSVTFKTFSSRIMVQFNMPVFANANGTGDLGCDDFTFTDGNSDGLSTLTSATCTHTAGNSWVSIAFAGGQFGAAGDTADSLTPNAGSIFTVGGAVPNKAINLTSDSTAPTFTSKYKQGDDKILVTFSEPTFACTTYTALSTGFNYTDGNSGGSTGTSSYIHSGTRTYLIFDLNADLIEGDVDGSGTADRISVGVGNTVCDGLGNFVMMGTSNTFGGIGTSSDSTSPSISSVEAVKDGTRILITFSEPVFGDDTMATLDNTTITNDLTYADTGGGGKTLSPTPAIAHVAGNDWILLTLSGAVTAADLNSDTITAAGPATILDTFSNAMPSTPVTTLLQDTTSPTIISVNRAVTSSQNQVVISFSEDVTFTGGPVAGASSASTTAMGDMTTGCTIAGFGAISEGNLTYKTARNTVALSSDGTTFTITLAGQTGGYRTGPAAAPGLCAGIFTPTADVKDLAPTPNTISTTSTHIVTTSPTPWDTTAPVTAQAPTGTGATSSITLTWTTVGGNREYKFFYGKVAGSGTNFGGDEWGAIQDATLGTITTASTIITGLDSNTAYYFTPYLTDAAGNAIAGTEVSASTISGGSGVPMDAVSPGMPTAITAAVKENNQVVINWTDPTDLDLNKIYILKGKNGQPISGMPIATLGKGIKTYTDTDVAAGDRLEYVLKSSDDYDNYSNLTAAISVTVPTVAQQQILEQQNTQQVQTPPTPEERELINEEIVLLEKTIKKINKIVALYNAQIKKLNKKKDATKISKIKSVMRRINKNKAKQMIKLNELKTKLN